MLLSPIFLLSKKKNHPFYVSTCIVRNPFLQQNGFDLLEIFNFVALLTNWKDAPAVNVGILKRPPVLELRQEHVSHIQKYILFRLSKE